MLVPVLASSAASVGLDLQQWPPLASSNASLGICNCLSWHLPLLLLASSIAALDIFYCFSWHLQMPLLASSIDTSHKYMGAVSPLLPNAGRRSFSILTIYFFLFLFHFRCLLCLPVFIFIFFCLYNAFCLISISLPRIVFFLSPFSIGLYPRRQCNIRNGPKPFRVG